MVGCTYLSRTALLFAIETDQAVLISSRLKSPGEDSTKLCSVCVVQVVRSVKCGGDSVEMWVM